MKFPYLLWIILGLCGSFKGTEGVIWPCQGDKDCNSVVNATCSPNWSCRCPAGYVFSTNLTKCLKASLYGETCEESVQCSHMPSGARCKKRVCKCDDGYTYIRGRCRVLNGLGGPCKEDIDCWFGYDRDSVTCKQKQCSCAEGYYERYGNTCRRKSMGVNSTCVVDTDCAFIKENGIKCENLKCVSNEEGRRSSKEIGVQTSLDFFQLNTVPEINEEDVDEDAEIDFKAVSPDTDTTDSKFGDECQQNGKECKGLHHSICVENLCYCKLGYYPKNDICLAELGEKPASKELCDNAPTIYYNPETKKCSCKPNLFYDVDLRTCKKPLKQFSSSCTSQSQCSPYGHAYCNTEVFPKRCMCEMYAQYDERRQLCAYKEGLGAYCESNKACIVPHSICSKEKQCLCKENFVEKTGQCFPVIGGECSTNEECAVENSECKLHSLGKNIKGGTYKCKCQKKFVHIEDKCLKEAAEIGDECIDSEQCKPLLGDLGKCIKNKCGCDEHHHLSFEKCEEKKAIGEVCSKSSECFTPDDPKSLECRNSVCRCQTGYTTDIEKQICIMPKKNSSGRPSVLKIITFLLIGSAVLITSAALKQAYY